MNISLEFNPATGNWSIRYGEWEYPLRSNERPSMYMEIMAAGADMPDAAIALLSLLRPNVKER